MFYRTSPFTVCYEKKYTENMFSILSILADARDFASME